MSANEQLLTLNLKIWRQEDRNDKGRFVDYKMEGVSTDSSFLEMIDMLNDELVKEGKDPVSFDHDCREGICGSCAMMVNGQAHGPNALTTTCQLHMRSFTDGDTIVIEPWRSRAFPVLKDLKTDRSAFDKIIAAGGYISVNTGNAQDANNLPVSKENADLAMDAASCIGCGACVAACKNSSALLFVSAKINQYAQLPQGQVEHPSRVKNMVNQMDLEGFGSCTNTGACEAECPKEISVDNIIKLNQAYLKYGR